MYTFELHLSVKPTKYREVMNILELGDHGTRNPQCISQFVTQSLADLHDLYYREDWADYFELKERLKEENFRMFLGAIKILSKHNHMRVSTNEGIAELQKMLNG